jgi:antitoxin component YwqK of YwqJK toxin-antitoxin module
MSRLNRVHEDELDWDERLRTHQGVPFTGVGFRLYSNSLLMFEIPYINGRPEGLMKEWDGAPDVSELA